MNREKTVVNRDCIEWQRLGGHKERVQGGSKGGGRQKKKCGKTMDDAMMKQKVFIYTK